MTSTLNANRDRTFLKEDFKVLRLVLSFGGTPRAIIQTSGIVATQLMKKETVKIGFLPATSEYEM